MWTTRVSFGAFVLLACSAELVNGFTGDGTWYNVNQHNAPGSCGKMHYDNEYVVAVAHGSYDTYPGATANPNDNPICGKNLKATYQGKSVVVTVVDRCGDCDNPNSIDMSPTAFKVLADLGAGRLSGVEWDYTSDPAGPATGSGTSDSGGDSTPPPPTVTERAVPEPEVKRDGGIVSLVKTVKNLRRSTTHAGTDEPVSRRDVSSSQGASDPVTRRSPEDGHSSHWCREFKRAMPGYDYASVVKRCGEAPDATKRSTDSTTEPTRFKRRFNLPEPARLRRFHDAIQERDRARNEEKRSEAGQLETARSVKEEVPRSAVSFGGKSLRRRFSEMLEKREWLQKDHH